MSSPVMYLRHLASGEFGNVGWRMPTFSANGKRELNSLFANAMGKLKRANNNAVRRMVEQNFMEKYKALKNRENARYQRELVNLEAAIAEVRQAKRKESELTKFNNEMKALVNLTKRIIKARPKRGTTKPPRPPVRPSVHRPSPGSALRRKALQRNIRHAESVLARHQR